MFSMRFIARLYMSHHGPSYPFKDVGVVADSLTGNPQRNIEVPLSCQQKLHTQGFLDVPTAKNPEDPNLASVEAMQWVLLYLSICHDRCY
jgi:hypothetical protein